MRKNQQKNIPYEEGEIGMTLINQLQSKTLLTILNTLQLNLLQQRWQKSHLSWRLLLLFEEHKIFALILKAEETTGRGFTTPLLNPRRLKCFQSLKRGAYKTSEYKEVRVLINWLDDSGKEVLDNSSAAKFSLPATTLRFHLHAQHCVLLYMLYFCFRGLFSLNKYAVLCVAITKFKIQPLY